MLFGALILITSFQSHTAKPLSVGLSENALKTATQGLNTKVTSVANKNQAAYPPCNEADIPHYTAYKITSAPKVDGRLDEDIWKNVPKSTRFRDLISGAETKCSNF